MVDNQAPDNLTLSLTITIYVVFANTAVDLLSKAVSVLGHGLQF
jgi:hypothetical protein